MSIVVTELELNQYKKDFKSCQKLWKQNTIHISSLQLIQWTHWKTKNWLNFFHPSQPWKTIPSFIPNISLGWIWKKNQTTICNLFYSLFIMYEYFDNKTNWNTLYHLKTSRCMSAWKNILIIFNLLTFFYII